MSGQNFPPEKIYLEEWLLNAICQGKIPGASLDPGGDVWVYGPIEREE